MEYQTVFLRHEQKYILTPQQKTAILGSMTSHMIPDGYGRTTIRNVYFDTENYRLIRRSIEAPVYKEKLRIRHYGTVLPDDPVFVELKKKSQSVVYKRRIMMPEKTAAEWLCGEGGLPVQAQIAKEIHYFRDLYRPLKRTVFLAYEREAYCDPGGGDLRITFDENVRARTTDLTALAGDQGTCLLEDGLVLMEIKTAGAIPVWLTGTLSGMKLYKTSFSKYGEAYRQIIFCKTGGLVHV